MKSVGKFKSVPIWKNTKGVMVTKSGNRIVGVWSKNKKFHGSKSGYSKKGMRMGGTKVSYRGKTYYNPGG